MGSLQPWHWAVIIIAVVLLFGSKRLPDAARSLGKSMRIIKAETKGLAEDGNAAQAQTPPPAAPPAPAVQPAPPVVQPPAAPPRDTSI
ncbi:Sec-independent protein translocase subunit TatA [Longispora sp. NPDC051575]|uniref:Sec-independent protein translocase subunit TatA n=1 Tax=Longispora sp. NPDC051575 TaxID=3154943 RepID=UPI0034443B8B